MKSIIKKMFNFILPLLVIYLLICAGLVLSQRSLIYHPVTARSTDFSQLTLESGGDSIAVSNNPSESQRAVIYFGGNAEDTSTTMYELCDLFTDCAVFAMHYRGYGGSSGKPSEAKLHADAQALYDLAATKHSELIIIGRSLGSGVATHLASRNQVSRLILLTPYDSIAHVAAEKFPFVPVNWLIWDRFDSFKVAPEVSAPVLVIAAAQDEVIPMESTKRLVAAFTQGQCQFEIMDLANHNSLEMPKAMVTQFIGRQPN